MIENCPEPWRMLTAFGAIFFMLGFRFMVLRWREFSLAEKRLRAAIDAAECELRAGITGRPIRARRLDDLGEVAALQTEQQVDEIRIVQAKSDPPPFFHDR